MKAKKVEVNTINRENDAITVVKSAIWHENAGQLAEVNTLQVAKVA